MPDTLNLFRKVAFAEGISFLLIGITMVFKYNFGILWPNYIVGMAHGILFIAYLGLLYFVQEKYNWTFKKSILAFIASLIPFGTFIADRKLYCNNKI
jgi:integral membrane protein